jgi:hypothetical protein
MEEQTPLEKLDDAVHEFFAALGHEGNISGWVLAHQSSKLNADSMLLPLSFASDFTMGASTSPETAMGLAHLTAARLERALVFSDDTDD